MDYTLEEIYALVGKDDRTSGLTFKFDSNSYNEYGRFITVEFIYTQKERDELDKVIEKTPYSKTGLIKARYLGTDLPKDKIEKLRNDGILSSDILNIQYYVGPTKNTFHSKEKRSINKIEIPFHVAPNGKDLEWIYGFKKELIDKNIALCPEEYRHYLALKYYFEFDSLTENELNDIFSNDDELKEIKWEYLRIKSMRNDISESENRHLVELTNDKSRKNVEVLKQYLGEAGTSLKKMIRDNSNKAAELLAKALTFSEIRLNTNGNIPLHLDIHSYFHIYMRHVEEMKVNQQFEHKDNFQWDEKDVQMVIEKVIQEANSEIQKYFQNNPSGRFSKYGDESYYFEGDYYTFHIESNGRISTFHKNKKTE